MISEQKIFDFSCADGLYISLAPHSDGFVHEIFIGLDGLWFYFGLLFLLDPFVCKIFEPEWVIFAVITNVEGSLIIFIPQPDQETFGIHIISKTLGYASAKTNYELSVSGDLRMLFAKQPAAFFIMIKNATA